MRSAGSLSSRPATTSVARRTRASVLIIVMVTLVFASLALVAFMDKATNDLLVDHRAAINKQLRMEAYSALETTLAVLEDFREVSNGLHSPAEGWGDPLGFAGFQPQEGHTIDVTFEDESGKISLPKADQQTLSRLFQSWNVTQPDADMLADAMMGWMKKGHVYSTPISPDYEQSAIPYEPPARPIRSYSELAAIDKVREFFYDADGRPNDNWKRFVASVSLLNFAKSNLNGATPDTLAAVGMFDDTQQKAIQAYKNREGQFQATPGYFSSVADAQAITGQGGNAAAFGTTISALRIVITVHDGQSQFRVAAVVTTPNGGATVVQENATSGKSQTSATSAQTSQQRQSSPNPTQASQGASGTTANAAAATSNLRYPFTLLEIRENDEIPPAPPPPADPAS